MDHQLLEVRDCTGKDTKWRLVILDAPSIKQRIMQEVHSVPYASHMGYHKTFQKNTTEFLLARSHFADQAFCAQL